MKYDLKQVIGKSEVDISSSSNSRIVKLGISIIKDSDIYPSIDNTKYYFSINGNNYYFSKDGTYEVSDTIDEKLNINKFSIPVGCMAEYILEVQ